MFGPEHYVPVLRWKRGEHKALTRLEAPLKDVLTPLIEIPPDDFLPGDPGTAARIKERFPRLTAALELAMGHRSAFVDFSLLANSVVSLDVNPIQVFWDLLVGGGVTAIPVLHLGASDECRAAIRSVSRNTGETALRIGRADLARPTIQDDITTLLAAQRLDYDNTHLIVDDGLIAGKGSNFLYICGRVPEIRRLANVHGRGGFNSPRTSATCQ